MDFRILETLGFDPLVLSAMYPPKGTFGGDSSATIGVGGRIAIRIELFPFARATDSDSDPDTDVIFDLSASVH